MGWRSGRGTHLRDRQGGGGKLSEALIWWLDNGEQWRAAKAKADAEDAELPDTLEPPEILEGFGGWIEDFWDLSSERQVGFGIGPIPASAIEHHVAGWRYDDADMFKFCIRKLDDVYMKRQNQADETPPEVSARDAFRDATANRRRQ